MEFRGLDVYSLRASISAALDYLDQIDPEQARLARKRYGCLTPWQDEPAGYGPAMLRSGDTCENEATAQLKAMLEMRLGDIERADEAFFNAEQNARIVLAAEQYYRAMYRGARESWNLRDRHMFETLQRAMQQRGPDAKAIVWAHNSHVGNAAATAMGWEGEFNIGELCRSAYGDDMVSIGFGTDRGTVTAGLGLGRPGPDHTVLPARADSYEHVFRRTGMARSLTDWRGGLNVDLARTLSRLRLERAIGVIYRPDAEFLSHYFRAVLAEQFDAYVWFAETSATTPFGSDDAEEAIPETYPFGL